MTEQDPQTAEQEVSAFGGLIMDCAAMAGSGLITYGMWLIYHPAAFIVGGSFLLGAAWLAARKADA